MSASFNLYLGADIIVKAISERYLSEEDQVARNLLKMASKSGIKMFLSEFVLEEVYTHIRGTYYEFMNHFADIEPYVTRELARNSDKILIRTYFYAKSEKQVSSWKKFLEQFMTYSNIPKAQGREELRKYLLAEYNLTFTSNKEFESVSNPDAVKLLSEAMLDSYDKKNELLAANVSLLVHGIYGLRDKHKETLGTSEFGLKTWWMTNQTKVLRHTAELVRKNHAQYILRPEYLLNFIALAPDCASVRDSYQNIFPSVFGVQLGHRLKEDALHKVLAGVREWKDYEPGRIKALMSDLSDRLKVDRLKRYPNNLNGNDS